MYRNQFSPFLFQSQRPEQHLPNSGETSDPFAEFLSEQRKREAELSWNRVAKKPKVADQKTATQPEEVTEDVAYLKKQLDEKNAECATLKNQVTELQRTSVSVVEALNRNQEHFSKVSRITSVKLDWFKNTLKHVLQSNYYK